MTPNEANRGIPCSVSSYKRPASGGTWNDWCFGIFASCRSQISKLIEAEVSGIFSKTGKRSDRYPTRCLVVESTWASIERGEWRSQLKSSHVLGSLMGWISNGLPVVMAGDHHRAGRFISRILFIAARRRFRELQGLISNDGSTDRQGTAATR